MRPLSFSVFMDSPGISMCERLLQVCLRYRQVPPRFPRDPWTHFQSDEDDVDIALVYWGNK
jgi:hypothetical protein